MRISVGIAAGPGLLKVNEAAEFQYGTIAASGEAYAVETFGRIFAPTRQTLVNDDVGALRDLPAKLGAAARRFEAEFVVGLVEQNPTMGDGVAVFHAQHDNLGGSTPPDSSYLNLARLRMRKQKGADGGIIGVEPRFMLVPPELETLAQQLLFEVAASSTENVNPFSHLTLIVEPRLKSATRWFLVADPALIDGLEYAYLEGAEGPQIDTRAGFEVDGVEFRVRLDFGGGWTDYRGWQRAG